LQGPYVYALYKSYSFTVSEIALLFVAGFLSSALFGTAIGSIADTLGRKKLSLAFSVIYSLSCITKLSPTFYILMIGRILGGISTSLLFSVFEAWMVSEHQRRGET
jgi:MFS family permease